MSRRRTPPAATTPTFPLDFDVDVTPAGAGTPAGSTTGTFDALPPFGGSVIAEGADVDLSTGAVTIVELSGVLRTFGDPFADFTQFDLAYLDAAGGELGTRSRVIDPGDDGSYSERFVVPENTDDVVVTWVRGPEPADYETTTLSGLGLGVNQRTFDPDFVTAVQVDITATLTVDGAPTSEPTYLRYRAFDGNGTEIVGDTDVAVTPDAAGVATAEVELPAAVRRVDVAWLATVGPAFTSFDVEMGENPIGLVDDTSPVIVELSGTLTEAGLPFAFATDLEYSGTGAGGTVLSTTTVRVTPNASGVYSTVLALSPNVSTFRVRWPEASTTGWDTHPVAPGTNQVTFDANIAGPQPQALRVTGAVTIDGDPWPGVARLDLYLTRTNGNTLRATRTVVLDPTTGEYELTEFTSEEIVRATVVANVPGFPWSRPLLQPPFTKVEMTPDGTTEASLDAEIPGRAALLRGTATDDGGPPVELWLSAGPDGDPVQADLDTATGDYEVVVHTPTEAGDIVVGASADPFSRFPFPFAPSDPLPLGGGVTVIDGVDLDVTPPTIDLTGNLMRGSAAFTAPTDVIVTWVNERPPFDGEWTDIVTITPDGAGNFAMAVEGPTGATRATVVVDVAAPIADRSLDLALAPGTNVAAPLVVDFDTVELVVTGTMSDAGAPLDREFTIEATAFDATDTSMGTREFIVTPDGTGGYTASLDVPAAAVRVELVADLNRSFGDPVAFLRYPRDVATLDGDGSTDVGFSVATTRLELSGSIETVDGDPRERRDVDLEITARNGATELATFVTSGQIFEDGHYSGNGAGDYESEASLPDGTDTVEVRPLLAGTTATVITGIVTGSNIETADFVTDAFVEVEISGILASGGTPATGAQLSLHGFVAEPTAAGERYEEVTDSQSIDLSAPVFTGTEGQMSATALVPPEIDLVEFEATLFVDPIARYRKALDLRGETAPVVLPIDVDLGSDRLYLSGQSLVNDAACVRNGEVFPFQLTVRGYAGDPADGATPAPTVLLDDLMLPSPDAVRENGIRRHWSTVTSVPAGITHLEVEYSTAGLVDPAHATLESVLGPIGYPGGVLELTHDLLGGCTP